MPGDAKEKKMDRLREFLDNLPAPAKSGTETDFYMETVRRRLFPSSSAPARLPPREEVKFVPSDEADEGLPVIEFVKGKDVIDIKAEVVGGQDEIDFEIVAVDKGEEVFEVKPLAEVPPGTGKKVVKKPAAKKVMKKAAPAVEPKEAPKNAEAPAVEEQGKKVVKKPAAKKVVLKKEAKKPAAPEAPGTPEIPPPEEPRDEAKAEESPELPNEVPPAERPSFEQELEDMKPIDETSGPESEAKEGSGEDLFEKKE